MSRIAVAVVGLAALAGCAPDGDGSAATVTRVASGNAFQDGSAAVGVGHRDATSCGADVAGPDGTDTHLDVTAGDLVDADHAWEVVATGAEGLTVRSAP